MDSFGIYKDDIELVTKSLKERLEELVPSGVASSIDDNGVTVETPFSVPVIFGGDSPMNVMFSTPSIALYNPELQVFKELITNLDEYTDYDFDALCAKKLDEPIPIKLIFRIVCFTQNPSNDNLLLGFLIKLKRLITYLDLKLSNDSEEYLRVLAYVNEPKDYILEEPFRLRESTIEVWTYLYSDQYETVSLISGENGIAVTERETEYFDESTKVKTSFNVFPSTKTISIVGDLKKYPVSGSAIFLDGDCFTYTNRSLREFYNVQGLKKFHSFGSTLMRLSN